MATDDKPAAPAPAPAEAKAEEPAPAAPEAVAEGGDAEAAAAAAKKKKKNKRKKKKKNKALVGPGGVGDTAMPHGQSYPPTKPIKSLFAGRSFPEGETQQHPGADGVRRIGDEELRAREREMYGPTLEELREASEAHRQARRYARSICKPGMKVVDVIRGLEKATWDLVGADGLKRGWGFPCGMSINECAAHWTPNSGDTTVVKEDDVIKMDFGVHINGRIIDSACTLTWNDRYDPLLEAVRAATNAGIENAGIDARLGEIGAAVEEVMESHEIELDGKVYPVKCIRNLNGHNINPYIIHGGKSVPIVKTNDNTKMEEGEVFAIETFGSTGRGHVVEDGVCSHYMRSPDAPHVGLRSKQARSVLAFIDRTFDTLPFCRRWMDDLGCGSHLLGLRSLCEQGLVTAYPPLVDRKGCYTAQYEHTLMLLPTRKEVVSRGEDY